MRTKQQFIIYGAGARGGERLTYYGAENVKCFCDSEKIGRMLGKDIISFDALIKIWDNDKYRLSLAIDNVDAAYEVMLRLQEHNIPVNVWDGVRTKTEKLLHVYRGDEGIIYDYDCSKIVGWRAKRTVSMLQEMFAFYSEKYIDVQIDFYIYIMDDVFEASRIAELLGVDHVFAYSYVYGMENVIAIPDYRFIFDFFDNESYYGEILGKMEKLGKFSDSRAVWAGNLDNDKTRRILVALGKAHTDKLLINAFVFRRGILQGKMDDPKEWSKFKYLIDIRGFGWTDRVKYLLGMRRPLLLVDRPYREYYYDDLRPMVHFVPVKEDLSDLLDKINFLDENPDLYKFIVDNATRFVNEHFRKEIVRYELHERVHMYGVLK